MNDPFAFVVNFFENIGGLVQALYSFLFEQINIIGINFTVWQLLGGGAIVAIIIAVLVKTITPIL